jgi:hypothetical protein
MIFFHLYGSNYNSKCIVLLDELKVIQSNFQNESTCCASRISIGLLADRLCPSRLAERRHSPKFLIALAEWPVQLNAVRNNSVERMVK